MWTYVSRTGELFGAGLLAGLGYSGQGEGRNNPDMEAVPNVGPIPAGRWIVSAMVSKTEEHGPFVLLLVPEHGTETHGRSGFRIHGDSVKNPGMASLGCIVLPRKIREAIWSSGDRHLTVVHSLAAEAA